MKRFVRGSLFFIIPCLIFMVAMEFIARGIPNSYKYKDEWIQDNGLCVKTLILGSSVTNAAILPSMLDSAFCMANSSQNLEYDAFLLTKYANYCPNLKIVILPIDYCNLFAPDYEDEPGFMSYRAIYYKIYMGYPRHSDLSKWNFEISNPMSLRNKLFRFIGSALWDGDYGYDSLGRQTEGKYYVPSPTDKDEIAAQKYANSIFKNYSEYKKNAKYIEEIAITCKEKNIRLFLLTCPKWHGVLAKLDKEKVNKILYLGHKLQLSYPNVTYNCFLSDSMFTMNPFFFRDITHMTDEGAKAFTSVLTGLI